MDERLKKLNDKIEKLKYDRLRTNSEVQKCVIDKEIEKLNIESKLIKDNIKQPEKVEKIIEKVEPKESLVVEKSPDEGFIDKTVNGVEDPVIKEEESEEDSDLPNSFVNRDNHFKYNKHNKNNKYNNNK